ncbi:YfiT family bacillithiol transferase [Longirhabdus pacifica]|uniref:YfiT family bacillithiol transferase n=1 Tax=Longirhabdus pacifica TaxID=2305227 RepID=UPI00100925EF|nr:putative metal-dependent hydrolase [Longirhabdus pacifica]
MEHIQYPIGRFKMPVNKDKSYIQNMIQQLKKAPQALEQAMEGLTEHQLDTPYRTGGWTIRQVVHHIADSQVNGYQRFRLGLTENNPTIKPYDQDGWVILEDAAMLHPHVSIRLLSLLHERWICLAHSLTEEQWKRTYHNPESNESIDLNTALCLYTWHVNHHTAHILNKREREQW